MGEFDQPSDDASEFDTAQPGAGELAIGRGTTGGVAGHYLPGAVADLRVWTGALSADQVRSQILI